MSVTNTSVGAWDATVAGAAKASTLSTTLIVIYTITIFLIGAWFFLGLFRSWSQGKLDNLDVMFYACRFIGLLIFTTFFF
ncbi:MAG: TIGR03758 family integrating conjugative element protein [Shewanella xiamenensis]|jgi:integrating conjugative element protein (TIGR03758 family)|uniref:DUF3262 family protein n=2 Tax=Shewanella TaxID=22 RepID=A0AAE4Q399_9GAMM|nr:MULTISPECIES: DUF3262 family protein [Shewanella]MCD8549897.1 TIGR03758 family integrating conjugative element protein [Shewanella xiamenensis]MCD8557456.1 TIGR03758 family integrating conjugative element protein [Shewanella xiamenensis]MCK7657702.1 TIGR03758 family integrating conjugative element protein [Shewanella sp. JNE4-2]MCT8858088.1 TIGR03758 family integrating conjugative element protein [Shewanella xiamenensis]MDH0451022.1 TIGR03758 family integrating conjugative element protein [